jgi:hypothetical protein
MGTLRDNLDIDMKRICTFLLVTVMRYAEVQRFRYNPDWLDGRFIYLHRGSMMKVKAKQKERGIRQIGKSNMQLYVHAITIASEIAKSRSKPKRWVGIDPLHKLQKESFIARLERKTH